MNDDLVNQETVSALGRAGFASGADAYENARPSYPATAVLHLRDALRLGEGTRVLDLAAGTGKMTRLLVELSAGVSAVEPSADMRTTFSSVLPGIPVLDGTAEAIPVPDGSFDAVVVAQAFHWFDRPKALAEIARVLRPGGSLGLVWNELDEEKAAGALLADTLGWRNLAPYENNRDYRAEMTDSGLFGPVAKHSFPWKERLSHGDFLARRSTTSYLAAMPELDRAAALAEVGKQLAAALPDPMELPYRTDVYSAVRI